MSRFTILILSLSVLATSAFTLERAVEAPSTSPAGQGVSLLSELTP